MAVVTVRGYKQRRVQAPFYSINAVTVQAIFAGELRRPRFFDEFEQVLLCPFSCGHSTKLAGHTVTAPAVLIRLEGEAFIILGVLLLL